jgi:hypothetical protein
VRLTQTYCVPLSRPCGISAASRQSGSVSIVPSPEVVALLVRVAMQQVEVKKTATYAYHARWPDSGVCSAAAGGAPELAVPQQAHRARAPEVVLVHEGTMLSGQLPVDRQSRVAQPPARTIPNPRSRPTGPTRGPAHPTSRQRPAEDLAYPPQSPLLPLARRAARQSHPCFADPCSRRG